MTYPLIPIGLMAVFIAYLLYLALYKKDMIKFKTMFYPGLFFILIWAAIYYFLFR